MANLTYPGTSFPRLGLGASEVVVPNPAAGADWSTVIPQSFYQYLICGEATFTASATVANRFPRLTVTDGVNNLYQIASGTAITNGQVYSISFAMGAPGTAVAPSAATLALTVPVVWMQNPWTIGVSTIGLQAGDQWSAINLFFASMDTPKGITDPSL